ncbi:MAG: class I SAM-dependent methyltransferase [Anaerocolumna aminovalerica]|uniref:class I SAM-dependent methyltransferase n=1 Tax=Anaerocolumna aminovalerica TaxID=1527 RepID=UPI000B88F3DE|nr:class I SAM-dependent methyltransferase [Anaerocolumna aminovalerica]MDU6265797.1 class I SAM-dependent methyltransferase [Anaerocolumna aminovalerica]
MDSIDYYNKNASIYFENTVDLNIEDILEKFISYLPEAGNILDLGCGSGRDSLYFINKGFDVTAMDGSEELCQLASIHIGQDVLHMQFSELDFQEVFDGIWACASLLHTTPEQLHEILGKISDSLNPGGVLYMSFKYGDFQGYRNGRYFADYKFHDIEEILEEHRDLTIMEIWKTSDIRTERDESWLNIIVRKAEKEVL